ncbi:ALF repeat-containing protein [Streptomyces sp. NPDC048506]|uniref:ALF repeat-containing protein n=1 Tax=Streptomyces sp. NPDC048506 TaxID=3155028 RepID=UPI0034236C27
MKLNRVSAAVAAAAIAPAVLLSSPAFAADGHKASAASAPDTASEAQKGDAQKGEASKDSTSSPKNASDEDNRFAILKIINKAKPGSRVYEAAQEAMNGSAEDREHFLQEGYELAQFADDTLRTVQISSIGGKAVRRAALEALRKDTHEALRQFLEVGQYVARDEDNSVEIARILHKTKRGSVLFDAAQEALDGSPEDRTRFLEAGQYAARVTDDRISALRILSAGGPHVREAAKKALRSGEAKDVRHFLDVGQYEARKLDEAEAAKDKNNKDSKGDENAKDGQESKEGKATDGDKQNQDGANDAKKSNGTTDAKRTVATSSTGSSGAQLASTGASSATPWAIGGAAAALTVGAGLVVASRRRTASEH